MLLAIVLALSIGAAVWVDSKLQRIDALQDYDGRLGGTSGTNWLLVGSDSRAGLSKEDGDRLMADAPASLRGLIEALEARLNAAPLPEPEAPPLARG